MPDNGVKLSSLMNSGRKGRCRVFSIARCLGRYLPFFIGDKISDNYHWENYLTHLEIMDEVFVLVIHEEQERPLTPKMHYLVHIPTWIRGMFGAAMVTVLVIQFLSPNVKHM